MGLGKIPSSGELRKIFARMFAVFCDISMRSPAGKSCFRMSPWQQFVPLTNSHHSQSLLTSQLCVTHITLGSNGQFRGQASPVIVPAKYRRLRQSSQPETVFLIVRGFHLNCSPQFEKERDGKKYFCLQKTNTSSLKSETAHNMCAEWQAHNI